MTGKIDALPPLRDFIRRHRLSARKSLGQNFLLDLNLAARIARAAGPLEGVTVIVEFLCETDQVEPGNICKPKEGTGSGLGAFNVRGAQLVTLKIPAFQDRHENFVAADQKTSRGRLFTAACVRMRQCDRRTYIDR